MIETEWRKVNFLNDNYVVNRDGCIKRIDTGRILKQTKIKNDYFVQLCYNNSKNKRLVLVKNIVYSAFVSKVEYGGQKKVFYLDGDSRNNSASNLSLLDKTLYRRIKDERWIPIKEHEGFYEVSNKGRIRSVDRYIDGRLYNGKIICLTPTNKGYITARLRRNSKSKSVSVHAIVYDNFIGKGRSRFMQIDHIDNDKSNNCIENLQLITARQNIARKNIFNKYSSVYSGVHKRGNKWAAELRVNGKKVYLGAFDSEVNAKIAYDKYVSVNCIV